MAEIQFLPGALDIKAYQGDTLVVVMTFKDEIGDPKDLTDYVFEAHILDTVADDSVSLPVVMSPELTDPPNGVVTLTVESSSTEPLNGAYVYDVQATDPNGNVRTYLAGNLTFEGEVTR